jgi:hypothetical protein
MASYHDAQAFPDDVLFVVATARAGSIKSCPCHSEEATGPMSVVVSVPAMNTVHDAMLTGVAV